MKIAIKGHEFRGKEVIQLLESLGGKNDCPLTGKDKNCYYYIYNDSRKGIRCHDCNYVNECKKYTLEEFEKAFPFKIGDKVTDHEGDVAIITGFAYIEEKLGYSLQYENGRGTATSGILKPYKEMKEERNIKLTLEKAKEWYKKGGELREIALQAFTEKELTKVELPRSWEEFCKTHDIMPKETIISGKNSNTSCIGVRIRRDAHDDRNVCPSKESAEAHLAMIQLEQLRDCWRQGWEPNMHQLVYAIKFSVHGLAVYSFNSREFLTFPTKEMAEEFLKCFRDLIEKAGDLI